MTLTDPPDRYPDEDLISAIARGDGAAFSAFYRRHLADVAAYLLQQTRDPEAAADLAAEVFAAVLLSASRYRADAGPAGAWLFGIARNKLRLSWRRHRIEDASRRRLGCEPLELTDSDLERIQELADTGSVIALMHGLPSHEREAVQLRVVEEQSYDEIAERLDCSAMVIRKRVSRALGRLRRQMEQA